MLVRSAPAPDGLAVAQRAATEHLLLQAVALLACGTLVTVGVAASRVTWAATAFVAIDLFTVGQGYLDPLPDDSPVSLARDPAVGHLLSAAGDDRAGLSIGLGIGPQNLGLAEDFRAVGGYESVPVWRWVELLQLASTGRPYPHAELQDDLAVGYLARFDSPLIDVMGVRWFVATEAPGPRWVDRTPAGAARRPGALRLFENESAMPPAFLVHHARVEPGEQAQARAVGEIDPRREVVLDRAPTPAPCGEGEAAMAARVVSRARARLVIQTDDPCAAVLVVSETMYPGWRARIDGRRAELYYADYALRGVAVPAGEHEIEMWFEPPWGRKGVVVTFISLALVGVVFALSRRRDARGVSARASATGSTE
jgi:hypothetical protein